MPKFIPFSSALVTSVALVCLAAASWAAPVAKPGSDPSRKQRAADERQDRKLDLNTANQAALAAVPVIGPDGAQAIIAARPYARIDDLNRITGISAERLEQIRARVTVSPESIPPAVKERRLSPQREEKAPPSKVDINTADLETLSALASVGPKTAEAIVAKRPFKRWEDINRIGEISTERLEQMRLELTIGEAVSKPAPVKR